MPFIVMIIAMPLLCGIAQVYIKIKKKLQCMSCEEEFVATVMKQPSSCWMMVRTVRGIVI